MCVDTHIWYISATSWYWDKMLTCMYLRVHTDTHTLNTHTHTHHTYTHKWTCIHRTWYVYLQHALIIKCYIQELYILYNLDTENLNKTIYIHTHGLANAHTHTHTHTYSLTHYTTDLHTHVHTDENTRLRTMSMQGGGLRSRHILDTQTYSDSYSDSYTCTLADIKRATSTKRIIHIDICTHTYTKTHIDAQQTQIRTHTIIYIYIYIYIYSKLQVYRTTF